MGTAQLGTELSEEEVRTVVEYLKAHTGQQPLVDYPVLPPHTEDTPPPEVSVEDVAHD
jgi:cytochrome c peroxidase